MVEPSVKTHAAKETRSNSGSRALRRNSISVVALVFGTAALALSAWALLRTSSQPDSFDEAAGSASQESVCAAFETVRQGVALNTNASAPGGPEDVSGGLAVAANARLALLGGGEYLLARLSPATPDELADPAREFADTLLDIGATSIAGVSTQDSAQAERLRKAEELSTTIAGKCGS